MEFLYDNRKESRSFSWSGFSDSHGSIKVKDAVAPRSRSGMKMNLSGKSGISGLVEGWEKWDIRGI